MIDPKNPHRRKIQKYDRLKKISIEEGYKLIRSTGKHTFVDNAKVNTKSMRLESFLQNGLRCSHPGCTYVASFFAIERDANKLHPGSYHLNLWGITEDGEEVLFTVDHVTPKMLGGLNHLNNTQTMCCWHNWEKGSYDQEQFHKNLSLITNHQKVKNLTTQYA